jgi:hypothetical protein
MIALQNMRMSCDSTYLLDHATDRGVKADELLTLLGETLEEPGTKVVIFSQWLRMHELLVRRLNRKRIGHVLFHGGVAGSRRQALVDRFRDDEACRVFLSTDAGGVGLNLQHASVVVNMDLPWNPAVLEQRIGRIHRIGQKQPVRVVNFIAQGTIEEGMLSVLQFKKSLFAGVLDGGESTVFLGGSRLTRFMETVEKTTTAIAGPVVAEGAEGDGAPAAAPGEQPRPAAATSDSWETFVRTGLTLLEQLAAVSRAPSSEPGPGGLRFVQRDPDTGQNYLRIPMPSADVLDRALKAIGQLLGPGNA